MHWLTMEDERDKIQQLRNNEYYCMQEEFDNLYKRSKENYKFKNLMEKIKLEKNIRLSYRNIKTNKGSKTNGLSGKNLTIIEKMELWEYIALIRKNLENYKPQVIKQVGIPKSNGKIRYLGIKEPLDKIIEQTIYQILNPITIAKFHNNSNGFIEGRSCRRAIAQMENYIIKEKLFYVVDIDLKGFFDNINHGKLLKQLWTLGIQDKNLISLISKLLKAEVYGKGTIEKGVPQGGILSPLLANVVLNELDWWLESKKCKGIKFVRYADDFKILCPTFSIARKMLKITAEWLRNRLKLEVNEDKTKIVNLKKNYSDFLGIRIKVKIKKNKIKIISHMSEKAIEKCEEKVKKQLKKIKKHQQNHKKTEEEIKLYNSIVVGSHNYYDMATMIYQDLKNISFITNKYIIRNFKNVLTLNDKIQKNNFIIKKYGDDKPYPCIRGFPIALIGKIKPNPLKYKGNKINFYEEKLRMKFYKNLELCNTFVIEQILNNAQYEKSVGFNDNVISKFCGQYGKCAISDDIIINYKNCIAIKKNKTMGDKYDNILIVKKQYQELLNLENGDDIIKMEMLKKYTTYKEIKKINKIRVENKLLPI